MRNRTSRDNLIFSNFIRCASIKIQPPCRANTVTPLVPPFLPPPLPRHGATVHLHHLSSLLLDNILCSSTSISTLRRLIYHRDLRKTTIVLLGEMRNIERSTITIHDLYSLANANELLRALWSMNREQCTFTSVLCL